MFLLAWAKLQKHIEAADITKQITLNCIIKSSWEEQIDSFEMQVFSTRAAKKQAVAKYSQIVMSDGMRKCPFATNENSTGSSI